MKLILLLLIVFLSGCTDTSEKKQPVQEKQPVFTVFKASDSALRSDKVNTLFIETGASLSDTSWKLWIGTDDGLHSFSPSGWETYTTENSGLKSNLIYHILRDNSEKLWIGTEYGISLYDTGSWLTNYIGRVLCTGANSDSSKIYFGTVSGIFELNGPLAKGQFTEYNRSNSGMASPDLSSATEKIYSIIFDNNQSAWFGTGDGLIKYTPGKWQIFYGAHKKMSMFGEISEETGNCPLLGNRIRAIARDAEGNLWIGTNGGVNVLNPATGIWHHSFSADKKISTNIDGQFSVKIVKGNSPLAGASVQAIAIYESDVWIGTSDGLSHYKNGQWKNYGFSDGLPSTNVLSLAVYESNIFVGTDKGLCWIH